MTAGVSSTCRVDWMIVRPACLTNRKRTGNYHIFNDMKGVAKTIRIDPELWHKARVKALTRGMTLQDLISKLIREYLGKEDK